MSPLGRIKAGIVEHDWIMITKGYEELTGETLSFFVVPTASVKTEEALRKIAEIVFDVLDIKSVAEDENECDSVTVGDSAKIQLTVTNDGEDFSLQLDEDKKTNFQKEAGSIQLITNVPDSEEIERNKIKAVRAKAKKITLARSAIQIYNVECNECGKTFKSDRSSGQLGQKCKNCLKNAKSKFT